MVVSLLQHYAQIIVGFRSIGLQRYRLLVAGYCRLPLSQAFIDVSQVYGRLVVRRAYIQSLLEARLGFPYLLMLQEDEAKVIKVLVFMRR